MTHGTRPQLTLLASFLLSSSAIASFSCRWKLHGGIRTVSTISTSTNILDQTRTRPDQTRPEPDQTRTRPDPDQTRTRPDQTEPDQTQIRPEPDQTRTRPEHKRARTLNTLDPRKPDYEIFQTELIYCE